MLIKYLKLIGIFILFFIILAVPIQGKIIEKKTECRLFKCESIFSIDKDLSLLVNKKYSIDKSGLFKYGKFLIHEGKIRDVEIEIIDKNTIKVSGFILGTSKNKWGFSILNDDSHLNSTWWNSSYNYKYPINCANLNDKIPIVINNSGGFYINGQNQIVWSYCSGTGTSVYFNNETDYLIANDTTRLPFEVEFGSVSSFNSTDVWDSDYLMVQHFNEENGDLFDSTTNGFNGTPTSVIYNASGKIANAIDFDGTATTVDFGVVEASTNTLTLEVWINGDNFPTDNYDIIIAKGTMNTDGEFYLSIWYESVYWATRTSSNGRQDVSDAPTNISNNEWYYVGGVFTGSNAYPFLNAIQEGTAVTQSGNIDSGNNVHAGDFALNQWFDGTMDELRISKTWRGLNYLNQTYENIIGINNGYGELNPKETKPPPTVTNISFVNPTPIDNSTHGFDYNLIINVSYQSTGTIDSIGLEWENTNISVPATGNYIEFLRNITAGTKYIYQAWINDTENKVNFTGQRILLITSLTEAEVSKLSNTFDYSSFTYFLLFVLLGILVFALIKS